jgi:hypothetical protein
MPVLCQRGNQNPYIEEEQTTQWPKEKVQKDKQRSTKHTHKTKDRATRTPLNTGGELRCSGILHLTHWVAYAGWLLSQQCVTVKTGFKRVLTYQSKLCHVKSRIKTNYEAVYYRQTHLMNTDTRLLDLIDMWAHVWSPSLQSHIVPQCSDIKAEFSFIYKLSKMNHDIWYELNSLM